MTETELIEFLKKNLGILLNVDNKNITVSLVLCGKIIDWDMDSMINLVSKQELE